MRFHGTTLFTYLLLLLAWTESKQGSLQWQLDNHFKRHQKKSDKKSLTYEVDVKLYSKGSGSHVQIIDRLVDAKGLAGSANAHLVLESVSFGKVRIRSLKSRYYICMNRKGNVIGLNKTKGQKLKRCVYQESHTEDVFTQFRSMKYPHWYLAFTRNGDPKSAKKSQDKQKATRFFKQYWKPKKTKQTKRHIRNRGKKKMSKSELRRKRRLQERQRKRLCLLSSLCLARKRRRSEARCRRISRQNKCR